MGHWIDVATDIPENARAHFLRYPDIRTGWDKCRNGVFLIWLVHHFGTAGDMADVARAASNAVRELRNALEAHFASQATAQRDDPLTCAYRDAIAEVAFATGEIQGDAPMSRRPRSVANGQVGYDAYKGDALFAVAEAVRSAIHPPEA
jgi:hypothetical protein